jgi:Fe-S cluster assembly protein SufB
MIALARPGRGASVFQIQNPHVTFAHEAVVGKVSDEQLSRGLTVEEAAAMIVNGFIEPVTKELPVEYAVAPAGSVTASPPPRARARSASCR